MECTHFDPSGDLAHVADRELSSCGILRRSETSTDVAVDMKFHGVVDDIANGSHRTLQRVQRPMQNVHIHLG